MGTDWRAGSRFIATLFLVGIALRPEFAGVPPLLPRIRHDFDLPYVVTSGLTVIPVVFLGAMAFAGPVAARRYGTSGAILVALVVLLAASLARALAPTAWLLLVLTIPIGAAIGLAGALIPAAAQHLSSQARGSAMGVYAMGLQVGTGGSAAVAGPLAVLLQSWRVPLVLLALPLTLAVFGWIRLQGVGPVAARSDRAAPAAIIGLIVVFGGQSAAFNSTTTWLPAHLQEAGWGEATAGVMLGVLNATALVGTGVVAIWVHSYAARRTGVLLSSLVMGGSLALLALFPDLGLIWVVLGGFAFGVLFPIALTLPLDFANDGPGALTLTAGTLGYGYLAAALASMLSGALRDLTGDFVVVFLLLALLGPVLLVAGLALRRPRLSTNS